MWMTSLSRYVVRQIQTLPGLIFYGKRFGPGFVVVCASILTRILQAHIVELVSYI